MNGKERMQAKPFDPYLRRAPGPSIQLNAPGVYQRMFNKLGSRGERQVWREDMPDLILNLLRRSLLSKLGWYFNFSGRLIPVPSPRSEDVQAIARCCSKYHIPMIPYSGGSSLEANFSAPHGGISIDFVHMDQILSFCQ